LAAIAPEICQEEIAVAAVFPADCVVEPPGTVTFNEVVSEEVPILWVEQAVSTRAGSRYVRLNFMTTILVYSFLTNNTID
jgi:hypothetical protein